MAHTPFTLVQISDLHLDSSQADQRRRLDTVRQMVLDQKPDLVVVSGDLTADGFIHEGMFDGAKAQLERFGVPMLMIPGNHDVGDKPGEKLEVKSRYVSAWNAVYGSDRFCITRGRWTIIGINTQIIGLGLREEAEQFEWLDGRLEQAESDGQQIALFLHAAPYLHQPDEVLTGPSQYWGFNPFPRRELLKRINRPGVKLVANGHLHWYRQFENNGTLHVWCPATSFIVDDAIFPRGGDVIGFVRYTFDDAKVDHELVPLELPAQKYLFERFKVEVPGREPITMAELVLDFTGTLSKDGDLLPGVGAKLTELAKRIRITVMTADTFGKAQQALAGLPLQVELIAAGPDKAAYVDKLGAASLVAIGNGRNDVAMVKAAAIGIAVVGPEGGAGELIRHADVVVNNIHDALDLVANPLRLKATLRD